MFRRMRRQLCAFVAATAAALPLCDRPARAQDVSPDVLQRLQRLEEQNQRLKEVLDRQMQALPLVDQGQVERLAGDYMEQHHTHGTPAPAGDGNFHEVGTDLNFRAFWKNGLYFATRNEDFLVHLRGRLMYDTGFFNADRTLPPFDDAQGIRSGRLGVEGRMWEVFRYRAEFDFGDPDGFGNLTGTGIADMADVFVEVNKLPWVGNFRAGHFKEPFGLEQQTPLTFTTFMERSLLDLGRQTAAEHEGLVPGRNTGMMLYNTWSDDRIYAALGWFRTRSELTGFSSGAGENAYTARLAALPYWESNGRGLVHIGAAYSRRNYELGTGPNYQSGRPVLLGTFPLLDVDLLDADRSDLLGGEFAGVWGPLSLQAELVGAHVDRVSGSAAGYWGYYVNLSYFLTGENRQYNKQQAAFDRIIPLENFFLVCGNDGVLQRGWGAWELAARYSFLDLGSSGPLLFDEGGNASEYTLGVNWYWNPNMRWMLNYVHASRDGSPAGDGNVDMLAWRFQVDW